MRIVHTGYEEAARPGSEGGNESNQRVHLNTGGLATQLGESLPGQGATTERRAVQLRLFTPDGAVIESHMSSARSGNDASAKAVTEKDPADSQPVNPTGIGGVDVSGGAI